jgi:hypothetical protein
MLSESYDTASMAERQADVVPSTVLAAPFLVRRICPIGNTRRCRCMSQKEFTV